MGKYLRKKMNRLAARTKEHSTSQEDARRRNAKMANCFRKPGSLNKKK